MSLLGRNCPDFRVDGEGQIVGPPSLRGEWYALIHCDRPCMPGCRDCMRKFSALADSLTSYHCRLVVALDTPEGIVLAPPPVSANVSWTLAHWRGPRTTRQPPVASALIVAPDGKVRATLEVSDSASLNVVLLLDLVRRAQEDDTQVHAASSNHARASAGCVDWFDFGSTARH